MTRAAVNSGWWRSWGYAWGYAWGSLGNNGSATADPVVIRGNDGRHVEGEARDFILKDARELTVHDQRKFVVAGKKDLAVERHQRVRIVT